MMNPRIAILGLLLILLANCTERKALRMMDLFSAWEKDSNQLLQKPDSVLTVLDRTLKPVVSHIYCQPYATAVRAEFPQLKYRIVPDQFKVGMVPYFREEMGDYTYGAPKYQMNNVYLDCQSPQVLLATQKYQNKVYGKLGSGFGSNQDKKNQTTAKALLERHYSNRNGYRSPLWIEEIVVNTEIDTALVQVNTIYSSVGKLYVRKATQWTLIRDLWEIME